MPPFNPDHLSRIGGAAQGGSARTPQEREALERQQREGNDDNPAGAGEKARVTPAAPDTNGERAADDQSGGNRTS